MILRYWHWGWEPSKSWKEQRRMMIHWSPCLEHRTGRMERWRSCWLRHWPERHSWKMAEQWAGRTKPMRRQVLHRRMMAKRRGHRTKKTVQRSSHCCPGFGSSMGLRSWWKVRMAEERNCLHWGRRSWKRASMAAGQGADSCSLVPVVVLHTTRMEEQGHHRRVMAGQVLHKT